MTTVPQFIETPEIDTAIIANADGTGLKTLKAAGAKGTKIVSLHAASDDTSDRLVQIWYTRGGVDNLLATVNVPTLAGTNHTAPVVNLMNATQWPGLPVDNDGQPYFFLKFGDTLKCKTTTTVTAAKSVYVTANGGNF